jgi:predicted membrane channel-forming protein YqfA (hemolysin III family)
MINILPVFIVIAIIVVIAFTELIKKLDKKDRLKGYRVWIPAVLSGGIAYLLGFGKFFAEPNQIWFWWAVIFAISTFAYEAILKKITTALGSDETAK